MEASIARDFMYSLRPSWHSCAASSIGTSGGLLATWDPAHFSLTPMLSPGGILLTGTSLELHCSINLLNLYGPCTDRKEFWQRLDDLGILAAENLILAGDLNLTTSRSEIWRVSAQPDPLSSFFQQLFFKNDLIDLHPPELLPTWRNGRQGTAQISKRLDRFLVAETLLPPTVRSRAWIQNHFISDHTPICLQIGEGRDAKGYPFKFNSHWLKEPSFISLVKSVWIDSSLISPGDAQGNLARKLSIKLPAPEDPESKSGK